MIFWYQIGCGINSWGFLSYWKDFHQKVFQTLPTSFAPPLLFYNTRTKNGLGSGTLFPSPLYLLLICPKDSVKPTKWKGEAPFFIVCNFVYFFGWNVWNFVVFLRCIPAIFCTWKKLINQKKSTPFGSAIFSSGKLLFGGCQVGRDIALIHSLS